MFKTYYRTHDQAEDALLERILEAVGHNTLVIELLAKNLNNFNTRLRKRYRLTDLLEDMQNKGMLDLTRSGGVRTDYQSNGVSRRIASPEEIIAAMYDLGKLDDEEWVIMRQHTTIGGEILKDASADFIKLAQDIALSHHEKWNGTGYPQGLKGTDIPLAGRIVALADVFDALTSERPYKEPFPLEKALAIIKEDSGSHFDPEAAEAFLAIEDEITKELNFWMYQPALRDRGRGEAGRNAGATQRCG